MTNEKDFTKTVIQLVFDLGLFTKVPRIIVANDFSPNSFKLKRGILPDSLNKINILTWRLLVISSQNFFLLTNLFENLLPAKYLISVAATIIKRANNILSTGRSLEAAINNLHKSRYKGGNGKLGWITFFETQIKQYVSKRSLITIRTI